MFSKIFFVLIMCLCETSECPLRHFQPVHYCLPFLKIAKDFDILQLRRYVDKTGSLLFHNANFTYVRVVNNLLCSPQIMHDLILLLCFK